MHNRIRGYKRNNKPPDEKDSAINSTDNEDSKPKMATPNALYKAKRLTETGGIAKSL